MAWGNQSYPLYYLGEYEEALKSCNKAIKYKLQGKEILINKSFILIQLGRYKEARKTFKQVREKIRHYPEADYNYIIACCFALENNVSKTMEHLKKAIELDKKYKQIAQTNPDFDKIRRNKRFDKITQT